MRISYRSLFAAALATTTLALSACERNINPTESGVVPLSSGAAIAVVVSSAYTDTSAAAERAALEAVARRFRPSDPEPLMEFLGAPERTITSVENSEFAQMLGVYYAIRDARLRAAQPRESAVLAATRRASLTVALSDTALTGGAKAAVVRRPNVEPQNVIVLAPDADAMVLGAAITTFKKLRSDRGDDLVRSEFTYISSLGVSGMGPKTREALERELALLNAAPRTDIPGIGRVTSLSRSVAPAR